MSPWKGDLHNPAQLSIWLVDREGVLRYFDVRGESLAEAVQKLLKGG